MANAAQYYVTTGGSGTTCSQASPCGSIVTGLSKLAAGDTLNIGSGTFDVRIDNSISNIPGGSSWSNATTIAGTPGQTILLPTTQNGNGVINLLRPDQLSGQVNEWVIWQDLILDGTNVNGGGVLSVGQSHNRFLRVEVKNNGACCGNPAVNAAVTIGGNAGAPAIGVEFSHGSVHDNSLIPGVLTGINAPYGFYDSRTTGTIIENTDIYRNGGYGIHGYSGAGDHSASIYRFNRLWDNHLFANSEACHILASQGNNHRVYGNVIYDTGIKAIHGVCIQSSSDSVVYNNTTYRVGRAGIQIQSAATKTIVQNNITVDSNRDGAGFTNIDYTGSSSTFSNNLCFGTGGTTNCLAGSGGNVNANPLFVDAANTNFQLQTGSPAINAGTSLGSPYNVDIVNTSRPQPPGGNFDLGAYEAGGITPSCPGVSPALVASYAFEDSSNDSTGNNHTASLGSGWSYTGGKYGRGVTTTGASGITIANHDALNMCGGFTYMGWINIPSVTGDHVFIVKNPDSKSFLFASLPSGNYCGSGNFAIAGYSQSPASSIACYATPITTGSFQHMAVTYDSTLPSGNVKLYINGEPVTSADGTTLLDATTGTLQFCTSSFDETCPSGTIIDEVRIYNYARTAAQIVSDMNTAIQVGVPTELIISGGTRRIGPGTTLRYGLKK